MRILLIDDDQVDRMAVRRALCKVSQNMEIDECADMATGFAALDRVDYDCAIVDYLLPDGNGAAFVKKANSLPRPAPPVVVLTGKGDRKADLDAMNAGAADYLEKHDLRPELLDRAIRYAIQNRQLVRKLKETNHKLKELDQLKTDFLSTASHELRTPLTIVREFIALVRDGITGAITDEQKECLESALKNCDRLGKIVNDLLDIQRIESGKMVLQRRKHDLAAMIERCCNDFTPACEKKEQQITYQVEESLPEVLCDEEKILQVLVNLIGNAHKFTPAGGTICVRAARDGDQVKVTVEDDGPGISEVSQKRIFDKFTQIDRNAGTGKKGTGLGLAITKKILDLHDETIFVESKEGRGSRFSFQLPCYTSEGALQAFVKDRTSMESARDKDWTLMLVACEQGEVSLFKDPDSLKRVEGIARRSMRCDDDTVLYLDDREILIILLQALADGGMSLKERLTRAISNEFGPGVHLSYEIFPVYYENLDRFVEEIFEQIKLQQIAETV
ncbi:MAG: sensor histidine kinase [Planctomycetota bacterium]